MEAVGIDVYKTAKNVGLEFPWSTKEKVVCGGLVLIEIKDYAARMIYLVGVFHSM